MAAQRALYYLRVARNIVHAVQARHLDTLGIAKRERFRESPRGWRRLSLSSARTLSKVKPVDVARQVLSAIETGRDEVLAADMTRQVKAVRSDQEGIYLNFDAERAAVAATVGSK